MAVGTVPARLRYSNAKTVRDELGKAQEILRKAEVTFRIDNVARTQWASALVPDVDIRVVDISIISAVPPVTGSGAAVLDVFASGSSDVTLITAVTLATGTPVAKTPLRRTLLAAANNVLAATPLLARLVNGQVDNASAAAPADITVEISYILADDVRTFS